MEEKKEERLEFRGGSFFAVLPLILFVVVCIMLFVVFKVFEMEGLCICLLYTSVNEAEKNADIKVVTFDPVGRFGRMYISGSQSEVRSARDAAIAAITGVEGRT